MDYKELADFIQNGMRMSHIYQPVMLMTLLLKGGQCDEREIAKSILQHDEAQIEYYINITNNMVGRVLRSHGCVTRDRVRKTYQLVNFETLSTEEVGYLIKLCEQRLDDFLESRGKRIFAHRRKSAGYISGSLQYEVLKRAKFRCELCGISADEKALEVDHIIPRSKGGTDDINNLQALCYSHNAMKRDRDATDFRAIRASYDFRQVDCAFCQMDHVRVIDENELVFVVRDGFPVTNLHSLIIPKRHVATYFELGQSEINASNQLLARAKVHIEGLDKSVSGFNIGINNGQSAGQTVPHCHIHLIPRRAGDVENPRGGIRHTIPGKGDY